MAIPVSDAECDAHEPALFDRDPRYDAWLEQLASLPSAEVFIRKAQLTPPDGRRLKDLQFQCEPITVQSVRNNVAQIAERRVLLAEIRGVHIGFCVSATGPDQSDPLFIQQVGVVPAAQGRGIGLALLTAAAKQDPLRNIALATQDSNIAARALNENFAEAIGASIKRIRLGLYPDRDLGITRGLGYRLWFIQRPPVES
ncbi:GNAT family N-acetyltransferase [Arthrobacter antibioticus]|uniref:GNAT family N-acetyltransferase n=1 Tax=Arthrobacter sp. H35-MC1 TaxID=3046203 RepID=UPI0024B90FB2|nr:GNAT family N-acetyltransferase [Arthrobacter sp. H35-MC1]MDJ0318353.1 GNAT family N-acetyltransferase [Arthrobacter sp. H35-MC1]